MSVSILEHIPLAQFSTFRMGGTVSHFAHITSKEDLVEATQYAKNHNLNIFILGGGSNTLFCIDKELQALVLRIEISGFKIVEQENSRVVIYAGAGEDWDGIVAKTVELGYSGMEALSAIPGSVGGTPVQNVGAYGQETSNILISVEVYDLTDAVFKILTKTDCAFNYRDSIFKHAGHGRYIIVGVTYELSTLPPKVPNYPGVQAHFVEKNILQPTLLDIRNAVIAIRASKLPDPKLIASVGSFFKNPIISKQEADRVKETFPSIVVFLIDEHTSKVGAGSLIDTLGLKGKEFGNLQLYPHNALVIVNKGGATYQELQKLVSDIQKQVHDTFGINIEPEPVMVK